MLQKFKSIEDINANNVPVNEEISKAFVKAFSIINKPEYEKILCSLSGGSDSDIMLDMLWRCDINNKIDYVWFDVGLEYDATKRHLSDLEEKYSISIIKAKPKVPIPTACKTYGQPFLSKQLSEYIRRLQKHEFKWEDKPLEELMKEYPRCQVALKWWCNGHGENSMFNIEKKIS